MSDPRKVQPTEGDLNGLAIGAVVITHHVAWVKVEHDPDLWESTPAGGKRRNSAWLANVAKLVAFDPDTDADLINSIPARWV